MIEGITSVLNNPAAQAFGESAAEVAQTRLSSDFDDFLLLLTTQLQNQDPLEPLDASEFTNQLVQFSNVEQAIATNQNLETLIAASTNDSDNGLIGYLGKTVVAETNLAALSDGSASWLYDIGANSETTRLTIRDLSGNPIATVDGANAAGIHELQWDGRNSAGNPVPEGLYTLSVEAFTADGATIATTSYARGIATEIDRTGANALLKIGDLPIDPTTVLAVQDPQNEPTDS
ncbi:MAG: flagellar hook capping FlgD N-terminal domain-containing protein [Pseudomonadota bacterium]